MKLLSSILFHACNAWHYLSSSPLWLLNPPLSHLVVSHRFRMYKYVQLYVIRYLLTHVILC